MEHTLKSGLTVTLKERKELTEREFRTVDRAKDRATMTLYRLNLAGDEAGKLAKSEGKSEDEILEARNIAIGYALADLTDEEADAKDAFSGACIAAMTTQWSAELPISADAALSLPHDDFEELSNLCAEAFRDKEVGVTTDPKADTSGSSDSATPSVESA
jgi:hypothetical protein